MPAQKITEPVRAKVRIIDIFSGMGGIRIGFEQAADKIGIDCECVFTSDIKPASVKAHKENWPDEQIYGDISQIDPSNLPDFDILLAGFPCQSFSQAGNRKGLNEARGTLFYDIAHILKVKKPEYFFLENVDNLAKHDGGKTLNIMNNILINELGYEVKTVILDAIDFGVPQNRKRIYIIGSRNEIVKLESFEKSHSVFSDIMEQGLPTYNSEFTERVLELYKPEQLLGKKFRDRRGGSENIHSWDLELRGPLNQNQKELMRILLKQRRRKSWAPKIGIKWMDGMPLTLEQIYTFYNDCTIDELKEMLDDLTEKKYLRFEHPKQQIEENGSTFRKPDEKLPKGYNIVTGKLSFELNKIMHPKGCAPTIVATEADHIGVIDQGKIRKLSQRECLRLFDFPKDYTLDTLEMKEIYDLIGNTVVVSVVRYLAEQIFTKNK